MSSQKLRTFRRNLLARKTPDRGWHLTGDFPVVPTDHPLAVGLLGAWHHYAQGPDDGSLGGVLQYRNIAPTSQICGPFKDSVYDDNHTVHGFYGYTMRGTKLRLHGSSNRGLAHPRNLVAGLDAYTAAIEFEVRIRATGNFLYGSWRPTSGGRSWMFHMGGSNILAWTPAFNYGTEIAGQAAVEGERYILVGTHLTGVISEFFANGDLWGSGVFTQAPDNVPEDSMYIAHRRSSAGGAEILWRWAALWDRQLTSHEARELSLLGENSGLFANPAPTSYFFPAAAAPPPTGTRIVTIM